MNKKFLIIGALLVLMAMVFTSCDDLFGAGDTGGTKFSKTMAVDGSNKDSKGNALAEDDEDYLANNYRRFFSKYSDDEKTGWITTTIEVDPAKTILGIMPDGETEITTINNAVQNGMACANFGFIFDYHTSTDEVTGDDLVDFCLLGVQPATGRYYVERYENINVTALKQSTKDGDAPLDTNDSAIGDYYTFGKTGTTFGQNKGQDADWRNLPTGALATNYKKDGTTIDNYSLTISIKQGTVGGNAGTPGTYEIYIGDTKIGTYAGAVTYGGNGEYKDYCVGGIGMYASCAKGSKISAKYVTTRNTTLTGVDKNVGPKFNEYGSVPTLD